MNRWHTQCILILKTRKIKNKTTNIPIFITIYKVMAKLLYMHLAPLAALVWPTFAQYVRRIPHCLAGRLSLPVHIYIYHARRMAGR
jgi:hypothetical protein